MTNAEFKTILAKGGVSESEIEKVQEKYDFSKISETIDAAHSPKEALEKIHEFYPELEVAKMQEQLDFIQGQIEAAMNGEKTEVPIELTEEELEMVAGGGFTDWLSHHWKGIVGAVICGTLGAMAGGLSGGPYVAVAFGILGVLQGGLIGYGIGHGYDD